MPKPTPIWTTPRAIAAELSCDVSKPLGWINRGELPAFNLSERIGERPRYKVRMEDWQDFLQRRRVQPPAPRQRRRRKQGPQGSFVPEYV